MAHDFGSSAYTGKVVKLLTCFQSAPYLSIVWGVFVEQANEVACQLAVCGVIDFVQHQVDEVKAGHQAGGQLDVVNHTDARIVAAAYRVGTCQHTGPGIQGGNDACLGYRHCLLFHYLMQLQTAAQGMTLATLISFVWP